MMRCLCDTDRLNMGEERRMGCKSGMPSCLEWTAPYAGIFNVVGLSFVAESIVKKSRKFLGGPKTVTQRLLITPR